jgi:hypothetical protein
MMHASVSFAQKEVLKEDVPIKLSTGTKTQKSTDRNADTKKPTP